MSSIPDLLPKAFAELGGLRGEAGLARIAELALELTNSRQAFVAVLNPELGQLEVRFGAGQEHEKAFGSLLEVQTTGGIVAYVAATGRPFRSGDVRREPRYEHLFKDTLSELAVPIHDQFGRVRAVLNIETDKENAYTERERHICEGLCGYGALFLEGIEQGLREEALIQINSSLDSALTEEALISLVIHVAGEVLQFQAASLFIYDRLLDGYVLKGSTSQLKSKIGEIMYQKNEGCTGWVCGNGQPILLQNPQSDARWRGRYVEFPSEQIASFLCVPILVRSKSEGAIRVLRRKSKNPFVENRFTENDLKLLEAIAEQVANGLENVRNVDRLLSSERMVAWGELSAKSSHMIGNRVFALKGDLNELRFLLQENEPSITEVRSLQSSLEKNVSRIEEILQEFRDFVSATQLHRTELDLNQILKDTAEEVFPKRSAVRLSLELDPTLPPVSLDPTKFRRAISELIENALGYIDDSQPGSFLTIRSRTVARTISNAHLKVRGPKYIEVEVEDSGSGVPEENKSKIFDPFYTSRVKGMGLGLSIVKGIIEAHGGFVREEGEEGEGAKFVILLPVM